MFPPNRDQHRRERPPYGEEDIAPVFSKPDADSESRENGRRTGNLAGRHGFERHFGDRAFSGDDPTVILVLPCVPCPIEAREVPLVDASERRGIFTSTKGASPRAATEALPVLR